MKMRRTWKIGITALICLSVYFVSPTQPAFAADVSVSLVTKSSTGEHVIVRDGAPLASGSQIRLIVDVPTDGSLSVSYTPTSGDGPVKLVDSKEVNSGRVILPGEPDWFEVGSIRGKSSFTIGLEGSNGTESKTISFVQLGEVNDRVQEYSEVLSQTRVLPLSQPKAPRPTVQLNGKRVNLAALALKKLEGMLDKKGTPLRGAAGAKIFRDFSRSVVLIVTDGGIGSGVVISDDGQIVTNWHVVQGATDVAVIVKPPVGEEIQERDVFAGKVIKVDQVRDLALVTASALPNDIVSIPFGTLESIEVGGDVHAIGHPTGESWTYTKGIVSQLRAGYKWSTQEGLEHEATVVQTQTPINPGNSGGPLFDDGGKLIGINSFGKTNAQGLNYAVSIRDVNEFLTLKSSRIVLAEKSPNEACAGESNPIDKNKNGIPEVIAVDSDCNGVFDSLIVDENEDGVPDIILVDANENGKPDLKIVKSKPNGPFDIWLQDEDEDNKPDVAGVDTDGDGEPDQFRKLS